ncbi:hypothetical protein F5Y16DRAFT_279457 [Xylariaceae sp. FL0255]|nr:hypothetical protein F5Y16DRAFT_279457 [Xylariaceae sp. FL0255]
MHRTRFVRLAVSATSRAPAGVRRGFSKWYNIHPSLPPDYNSERFGGGMPPRHRGPPHGVELLGPAIWGVAVSGAIFMGCAVFDVLLEEVRSRSASSSPPQARHVVDDADQPPERSKISNLGDHSKLALGIMASYAGVHAATTSVPWLMEAHFWHIPVLEKKYTVLTSTFAHASLPHLGFNLLATWIFTRSAGKTPIFKDSSPHLLAFYLCSGIFSALTYSAIAQIRFRTSQLSHMPAVGASGAGFALFATVVALPPEHKYKILFTPESWAFPIWCLVPPALLLETAGIFSPNGYSPITNPAHLGGLTAGLAYVTFDGKKRIWEPCRRLAHRSMQIVGLVRKKQ